MPPYQYRNTRAGPQKIMSTKALFLLTAPRLSIYPVRGEHSCFRPLNRPISCRVYPYTCGQRAGPCELGNKTGVPRTLHLKNPFAKCNGLSIIVHFSCCLSRFCLFA